MSAPDLQEVLQIEQSSFDFPWTELDFRKVLRRRDCIGKVAVMGEKLVGFCIYELFPEHIEVLNLAVHPCFRGIGVGKELLRFFSFKLAPSRRRSVLCCVRETNLYALLFLQHNGYQAVSIIRDYYESVTEDAILMEYDVIRKDAPLEVWEWRGVYYSTAGNLNNAF